MTTMTRINRSAVALLAVLLTAGCTEELTIPNFNSPAREDLTGAPNRGTVGAAVRGILITQRGLKRGLVTRLGVWGREAYDLRPEEPRTITDALIDPMDPVNGGLFFAGQYTQVAAINTVLIAADNANDLTAAEQSAIRGFVKTMKAEAFWQILMARPIGVGIPLDPNSDPLADLTPISTPATVLDHIFSLYDEADADLQGGGSSFPFILPNGLADYNTPGSFSRVNRALKARALKYDGRWTEAQSALSASFMDAGGAMDDGAYFDYSTVPGDATNSLFSIVSHFAHPRILAEAQLQADGSPDQRALDKTEPVDPFTLLGITATEDMTVYGGLSAPFPWITNDELLLIQAEVNLGLGNRSAAIGDVNVVRQADGGLDPLDSGYAGDLLGEIIYNRLYSLIWEGGFHYYDMRQYDRLADLPRAMATHGVFIGFPYPQNECLARDAIVSGPECGTYFAQ